MRLARPLVVFLGASIAGWISLTVPAPASASPSTSSHLCKKEKEKKKRGKNKKAKVEAKAVNVRSIVDWYRSGIDSDEILARAEKAAYVANKRDQKKLEERHLPRDLVLALAGKKTLDRKPEPEEDALERDEPAPSRAASRKPLLADSPEGDVEEPAAAKPAKKGIDLATIDPNQIDFDSVPPPEGVAVSKPVVRSDEGMDTPKVDPTKKAAPKPPARRPIVASP
ncbi:MAG: hypothetical protein HY791_38715 [Deltaproteobacteria bacterium]|nr:hypothetical protein [Deltaproteobacteria bacterium]